MLESNGNKPTKAPRELLKYWIEERYNILMKKRAGEVAPWSDDPIFWHTYFCNVHREDDKVTEWIRTYWNYGEDPNYTQAMCLARFVNKIETLEAMGYPLEWNEDEFVMLMNSFEHPWGGAYIVSTNGVKMPKPEYIAGLLTALWEHNLRPTKGGTCLAMFNRLKVHNGLGSFMSGQVVADLKNTCLNPLSNASDFWSWSTHGPGSLRGLGWYFDCRVTPSQYQHLIEQVDREMKEDLEPHIPHISMQDLQNCLCEYDKYMRILHGRGKSKRKYRGGNV